MFSIQNTGSWVLEDRYSTGHPTPTTDTTPNYNNFAVANNAGVNTYTFDRNLDTGDSTDYVILNGTTNLIYSFGGGVLFSQHAEGSYGYLTMTVDTTTLDVTLVAESIWFNMNQTLVNCLLAYIVWGWFSSSF